MTTETLQALYDSELNFEISTFWDAGFDWKLGDEMNGWKDGGNAGTLDLALQALKAAAIKHFPNSVFAQKGAEPYERCEGQGCFDGPNGYLECPACLGTGVQP